MTDRDQLLMMKGAISELLPAERAKVHECADLIREIVDGNGESGLLALALVGLEKQAQ